MQLGNVDTQTAQTLTVTTMAVCGALLCVRAAQEGHAPSARAGVGILFGGVAMTTAAQFAPRLVAPLALLWLTSSVFVYGEPALSAIGTAVAPPKAAKAPADLSGKSPGTTYTV